MVGPESVQQATEADWLTRTRANRCAKSKKIGRFRDLPINLEMEGPCSAHAGNKK
jgi:hypothetical protein